MEIVKCPMKDCNFEIEISPKYNFKIQQEILEHAETHRNDKIKLGQANYEVLRITIDMLGKVIDVLTQTPEEKKLKELKQRQLYYLKESAESLFFWLNELHPDLFGNEEALKELLNWKPEYMDFKQFKKSEFYEEGDENSPFFTEAFLYNLLGKEDTRTLLSLLRKALGIKGVGKL